MVPTQTELQAIAAVPELQVYPDWVASDHGVLQVRTVNGMLDEVGQFLDAVAGNVKFSGGQLDDALWMQGASKALSQVIRDVEVADAVIGSVLKWIETSDGSEDVKMLGEKADTMAIRQFEVKKRTHPIKRRLDVLANFDDVNNIVIGSLGKEVDNFMEELSSILASSVRLFRLEEDKVDFEWESLLSKIKRESLSTALHLHLPTFNEEDQKMYEAYIQLEMRMNPLKIALDVIPMRVDQFAMISGSLYPEALAELSANHSVLTKKWNYLQHEMNLFRRSYVDSKWCQIFGFLTESLLNKCNELSEHLKILVEVSNEIASSYKLCSQSVNILAQILSDKLITDTRLIRKYNNKVLVKWEKLNEIMSYIKPPELAERLIPTERNGFSLGLGIESPAIPFSIEKKDRIRDIFLEDIDGSFEVEPDNDNLKRSLKSGLLQEFIATTNGKLLELIKQLSVPRFPTRIPIITQDFVQQGYPRVKKKRLGEAPKSRIPAISPTHSVFVSPLRSPLVNVNESSIDTKRILEVTTPKLSHPDNAYNTPSPAIISSSPERPESAIGHRFNDKHLVPPFRHKHLWK
ncbi:uncharacterized protein KQ657_003952 [Scheffersomyces spartinae]|uniref:Karyogamy protein n=1 Tax=Scheffersomyces spartinae TaxID=45513 RepID=A0A9P8AJJ2_9ASCO|nr:uncharacterized protein KQ657_003952 [Scheffersomyces spartinae]KAG7194850.1 hypothetical protein KQ657_003952 [Scheffersomyces spartinae]